MKRAVLLVLAVAVACVPVAGAAGKTKSTVTLDAVFLGAGSTIWSGEVISPRKACKNRRRVLVFRERSGADAKVGSARAEKGLSDNKYHWALSKPVAAPRGKYYAKVKPTDTCQGDRSPNKTGP